MCETEYFLRRAALGGCIVSTSSLTEEQITAARADGRMLVLSDEMCFVYVPKADMVVSDDAMREAREAVGAAWFRGGVTLAEAIRRKCAVLEKLSECCSGEPNAKTREHTGGEWHVARWHATACGEGGTMTDRTIWHQGDPHPSGWPPWLRDAEIEWCDVEVTPDGVVWHDGEWRDGEWRGGDWRDGAWRDGVWLGGDWHDGGWHGGAWHGGEWLGGMWIRGTWRGGTWRGGEWHGDTPRRAERAGR